MVADIVALRDKLREDGVDHIVLGGMGGSSLAPESATESPAEYAPDCEGDCEDADGVDRGGDDGRARRTGPAARA